MAGAVRPAIQIEDLYVQYGSLVAVKGVSFDVLEGECFGLLGPNGAGKTSTLSVIEGLRQPARGRAVVAGYDMRREAARAKRMIGVQLQSSQYFPDLTTIELVQLTASFYHLFPTRKQALEQLARWGLEEKGGAKVGQLSGGQQQRLSLVLALVNDPRIVLLDEPTTGLDPQARRSIWQQIRQLKAEGRTVVLTTHYIEEAEMLCQRIGIIDHGALIALDTPEALIARLGAASTLTTTLELAPEQLARVRALPGVAAASDADGRLEIQTTEPIDTLVALRELAVGAGRSIRDVTIRQPNLEDVFISLTGHAIRD
jgi:ABC-2 type transport system ATP-binding protein